MTPSDSRGEHSDVEMCKTLVIFPKMSYDS